MNPGGRSNCIQWSLFIAIAVLLAGCATLTERLHDRTLATIHTVGVISLLGDGVHSYFAEPTLFTSIAKINLFPQWKIDEHAERVVRDSLNPRLRDVALQYDEQQLRANYAAGGKRENPSALVPLMHAIVEKTPVDAIIVISSVTSPDPINDLPVWLTGYGLYRLIVPHGTPDFEADMFVNVNLKVLDGRTFRTLASASRFDFQREFGDDWYPDPADLPPRLQKRLGDIITGMLGNVLAGLIADVGLHGPN